MAAKFPDTEDRHHPTAKMKEDEIDENADMVLFKFKTLKNNNMIKYENLTEIDMVAMYYILALHYYEGIEESDNMLIRWESNINYKETKDLPSKEEILQQEKTTELHVTMTENKKEKNLIVFKINFKEKTFTIQGKLVYQWEENEQANVHQMMYLYRKFKCLEQLTSHIKRQQKFEIAKIETKMKEKEKATKRNQRRKKTVTEEKDDLTPAPETKDKRNSDNEIVMKEPEKEDKVATNEITTEETPEHNETESFIDNMYQRELDKKNEKIEELTKKLQRTEEKMKEKLEEIKQLKSAMKIKDSVFEETIKEYAQRITRNIEEMTKGKENSQNPVNYRHNDKKNEQKKMYEKRKTQEEEIKNNNDRERLEAALYAKEWFVDSNDDDWDKEQNHKENKKEEKTHTKSNVNKEKNKNDTTKTSLNEKSKENKQKEMSVRKRTDILEDREHTENQRKLISLIDKKNDFMDDNRCELCFRFGHQTTSCRERRSCFICGKEGHIKYHCPNTNKKKQNEQNREKRQYPQKWEHWKPDNMRWRNSQPICNICRKTGHTKEECWFSYSEEKSEMKKNFKELAHLLSRTIEQMSQ